MPSFLTSSYLSPPYSSKNDGNTLDHTAVPQRLSDSARRKSKHPSQYRLSGFVDQSYWKPEKVCCGLIFKWGYGEILIDAKYFHPCSCQNKGDSKMSPVPTLKSQKELNKGHNYTGENYEHDFSGLWHFNGWLLDDLVNIFSRLLQISNWCAELQICFQKCQINVNFDYINSLNI